jgi:hypothetical protein
MSENNQTQPNINQHSDSAFNDVINTALKEGGLHLTASKGFGKSRLLFSMADYIRNLDNTRTIIFDGSLSWLYGYSKIAVFNISEKDIQLVSKNKSVDDIESYELTNFNLVKLALTQNKDLLFRLKTRKPSKRGFFVRSIINYLDSLQRKDRETSQNHEASQNIAYFIEEAQDAFNSRSTTRLEAEEFLAVFNEARNQKESFFTASQRFNDFSKTIRTKQAYCVGRINAEDINPSLRRIERELKIDLSKLPLRTWIYNGLTFVSPTFTQNLKPYIINRQLRKQYNCTDKTKPKSYFKAMLKMILCPWTNPSLNNSQPTSQETSQDDSEDYEEDIEDSEYDGALSLEPQDILFPSDEV